MSDLNLGLFAPPLLLATVAGAGTAVVKAVNEGDEKFIEAAAS